MKTLHPTHCRKFVTLALVILLPLATVSPVYARSDPTQTTSDIAAADLPKEAQRTLALIGSGGPFPYPRDGVTFGNREQLLPAKSRGYYHEYTVRTPGARTRGARRIICGAGQPSLAECYYTDDHYQSFRRIRP